MSYSQGVASKPTTKKKRITWTFEPSEKAKSLVRKAFNQRHGRGANIRGFRTELLNSAIIALLKDVEGKKEAGL